jgi:hypothetical protein
VPKRVGLKQLISFRSSAYENMLCPKDGCSRFLSNVYTSTPIRRQVPEEIIVLNIILYRYIQYNVSCVCANLKISFHAIMHLLALILFYH